MQESLNYDTIKNRFREIAFLNKGLRIEIKDERVEREQENVYQFMGGIQEFVADLTEKKNCIFPEPIYVDKIYKYKRKDENGVSQDATCEIEFSFQFTDTYTEKQIETKMIDLDEDSTGSSDSDEEPLPLQEVIVKMNNQITKLEQIKVEPETIEHNEIESLFQQNNI